MSLCALCSTQIKKGNEVTAGPFISEDRPFDDEVLVFCSEECRDEFKDYYKLGE